MSAKSNTTVRMFGALHLHRRERGLEPSAEVTIPPGGCAARDLALQLDLPLEKIEAVFVNHLAYGIDRIIQPGDRVAFVPTGIPVHRFFLGSFNAGQQGKQNRV
ncbi:MAG TPA: MoaD/ThiS family protein [Geobacteraceae bacterium]